MCGKGNCPVFFISLLWAPWCTLTFDLTPNGTYTNRVSSSLFSPSIEADANDWRMIPHCRDCRHYLWERIKRRRWVPPLYNYCAPAIIWVVNIYSNPRVPQYKRQRCAYIIIIIIILNRVKQFRAQRTTVNKIETRVISPRTRSIKRVVVSSLVKKLF